MTEPYGVGTVTVADGGTVVTGVGTGWVGKVRKNDLFTDPAQGLFSRVTADPTENDELAINPWPGAALAGAAYEIIPSSDGIDISGRLRELLFGLSLVDPNYDVQVDTLADRAAFDDMPGPTPTARGFAVLVSDDGDGAAIYSKRSSATADWTDRAAYSGPTGNKGWSPQLVAEADGDRVVLKLAGYVGGDGTAPTANVGQYLKDDGTWTSAIADAVDFRGEGFSFEGAYSGGATYAKDDVVRYNGSSWIALQGTTGNAPPNLPTTSNAYWELMAAKGNDGAGTVTSIVAGTNVTVDATDPANPIISVTGGGDMLGPASSTDGDMVVFDGPTGKLTKPGGDGVLPPMARPSLVSGVALPESDVTGATSVYLVPNGRSEVPIHDGTRFRNKSIGSGLVLALSSNSGHTGYHQGGKNFDLFVFDDAGTIRFGTGPSWEAGAVAGSSTQRGTGAGSTELEEVNGLPVNKNSIVIRFGSASGNTVTVPARRALCVGSVRPTADGQATDSKLKRLLSPMFNASTRSMRVADPANTWAYSTAALRQVNGNAANQLEVLHCVAGRTVTASHCSILNSSTTTRRLVFNGIGIDSTTTPAATSIAGFASVDQSSQSMIAHYYGTPGLGRHLIIPLEYGAGADTQTWFGTNSDSVPYPSGLLAQVIN